MKSTRKGNVTVFDLKFDRNKKWEQWFFLSSDEHFDNPKCDRKLLKKHLDLALERKAIWLSFGDLFCLMGGKYDPRSSKGEIRPEYNNKDYLGSIVRDFAKFAEPYKHIMHHISLGNHEAEFRKRHEIDPLLMVKDHFPNVNIGDYTGWVSFKFEAASKANHRYRTDMYYTHGSGGSAPVTKGIIQSARRQDYIDADILVSGHIHTEYSLVRPKIHLNHVLEQVSKDQLHIQLGTYKNSIDSYWESTKGIGPPSMGGGWIRFYYERSGDIEQIKFQYIRA